MQVHVVHAHPSEHSFTAQVRDELLRGLADGGHTATVSDLYRMGFATDMTEAEYLRDAHYDATPPLAPDVVAEQRRINAADALVLVYPVFWTEAPAKLVGWFDRIWSYGFAYGQEAGGFPMKTLDRALVIAVAGHTEAELVEQGRLQAMRTVMLDDRINDRARSKDLVLLGGTSRDDPERREANRPIHLRRVYELAVGLGR
ncbi:MAG: NAD(P)H-dependent oxidoreductase [Actinobacteria bacterium]|nr:NAD(P)H-dependent oxidoreductase [Actinomycetota bacterium]MCG2798400.1 NAD(P)H-dependent oxidoreductase [Cellulomonas sp.]